MITGASLPAGLRERVLTAAREARAAGRALPETPDISPVEAFSRAADAFAGLLAALEDAHWRLPVLRDLDVQGLVGHLVGVEEDVQRALAGDPDVARVDHIASTQPVAEEQAGRLPEETRRTWRAAAERTVAQVRGRRLDGVVAVHGLRLPLGALLVVRAFELWTHENDIRTAAGLPASVPDPSTLRLMTDLAVGMLPFGVARVADDLPALDVHLVLTGAGGGTWDIPLGARADGEVPEVAIVADAVGFCRLVADRIGPDALGAHVSGDVEHAPAVLAGAAALALD
ncbi:maleylpyruvate isomerase family mycothiol-dependent enzyme [Geodermatophilus sp. URMC 64]